MIPSEHVIPDLVAVQSDTGAPTLPIEGPIVAAALAVKDAYTQLALLNWLVANSPRDDAMVTDTFATVQRHLNEAWGHYCAYREILTCRGQA